MIDLIGHTIGQYQIIERIGKGGMAGVYNLYLANADGGQPIELAAGMYSVWASRFSPSGEKLLIEIKENADGPYSLYIVDTAMGTPFKPTHYEEKRATAQRWPDQWAMQYMVTGAEQRILDGLSQGIAAHKEATDRTVVIFRTGEQASEGTPDVIFLLEKIEGRWRWTSMLLAIFDLRGEGFGDGSNLISNN